MTLDIPDNTAPASALVVEGGAMRGIFAAGVLDAFMENNYRPFDFCIGVSAGSTNLAGWLAGQHSRSFTAITDHSCRPEFINLQRFIRGGHFLDLDWLWEVLLKEFPLDHQTLASQPIPLFVVTTRLDNGQAEYIKITDKNAEQVLKASCSVPIAYRDCPLVNGAPMTDGGIADAIPVIEAYNRGARDITVVLSRPSGYRKKPAKSPWIVKKSFSRSPSLAQALLERVKKYNQAIDFIQSPPADCRVQVIAPPENFPVSRFTKNPVRLKEGYRMGKAAGHSLEMAIS